MTSPNTPADSHAKPGEGAASSASGAADGTGSALSLATGAPATDDQLIARAKDKDFAALAWLLQRPGVSSLIVGGRTEEQFKDNLAAAELKLTRDEIKRLDEVSAPPRLYPYWHQVQSATDRLSAADMPALGAHIKA